MFFISTSAKQNNTIMANSRNSVKRANILNSFKDFSADKLIYYIFYIRLKTVNTHYQQHPFFLSFFFVFNEPTLCWSPVFIPTP